MPVYNAERYLAEAIQSILDQSYTNFEFLIINDGSTDQSTEIIKKIGKRDVRIILLQQPTNSGIIKALNLGLQRAKGKYIARMDADDKSLPGRLLKQVKYMESHPEIGILGCAVQYIDREGNLLGTPAIIHDNLSIRWDILFKSPFFHPTVMIRKGILDKYNLQYDALAHYAEDYDLWTRILLKTKGAILKDILLNYRLHPSSVTHRNKLKQKNIAVEISSWSMQNHLPNAKLAIEELRELSRALRGVSQEAKKQRAHLLPVYLKLWYEFYELNKKASHILQLKQKILGDAAIWVLYPLLQQGSFKAILQLTKNDWKWFLYFLRSLLALLKRKWARHYQQPTRRKRRVLSS